MEWILDGAVILVIALCAIVGFKRGFLKHVVLLLATVLAAGGAMVCMNMFTKPVYDKFVGPQIYKASQQMVDSVDINSVVKECISDSDLKISDKEVKSLFGDGELSDNVEKLALKKGASEKEAQKAKEKFSVKMNEKLSQVFGNEAGNKIYSTLAEKVDISNGQISKAANLLAGKDKEKAAKYINDRVFEPVVNSMLKVVIFIVCFILIYYIIKLILSLFGILKRLYAVNFVNRFAGLLLGLVKGGLYVGIVAFLLCLLVNSTNDSIIGLDVKTFESTRLFRYFFDFFYK